MWRPGGDRPASYLLVAPGVGHTLRPTRRATFLPRRICHHEMQAAHRPAVLEPPKSLGLASVAYFRRPVVADSARRDWIMLQLAYGHGAGEQIDRLR
jgi:hypothetical protein